MTDKIRAALAELCDIKHDAERLAIKEGSYAASQASERRMAEEALREYDARAIPNKHRIVPVKPAPEMINAALPHAMRESDEDKYRAIGMIICIWDEMLAAHTATASQTDRHEWKLIGSAGVWESYYKCSKCGDRFCELTDSPEKLPENGCATASQGGECSVCGLRRSESANCNAPDCSPIKGKGAK